MELVGLVKNPYRFSFSKSADSDLEGGAAGCTGQPTEFTMTRKKATLDDKPVKAVQKRALAKAAASLAGESYRNTRLLLPRP